MINYKKKNFWNQNEMSNGRHQPYPDDWWDADHLLFYKKNNFWENYPKFESSQVHIPHEIDGADLSCNCYDPENLTPSLVHRVSQMPLSAR